MLYKVNLNSKNCIKVLLFNLIILMFLINNSYSMNQKIENNQFRFEDYKTADEAKEALIELHPLGSDVGYLVKRLDSIIGNKSIFNPSSDDLFKRLSKKGYYIYFSYIKPKILHEIEWRVIIIPEEKDINKIDVLKVHKFLHTL